MNVIISAKGTIKWYIWAEAYGKYKVLDKMMTVKVDPPCTESLPEQIDAVEQKSYDIEYTQNNLNQELMITPFIFNSNHYNGCHHITRYHASSSKDNRSSIAEVNIWRDSTCST